MVGAAALAGAAYGLEIGSILGLPGVVVGGIVGDIIGASWGW